MQQIETISRGPQFKGILSTLGLVVFAFTLIIGIVLLVNDGIGAGILVLMVSFLAFMLFLDVRGLQIDYQTKQVRTYKEFLGYRTGEWRPLSGFTELHLVKDNFYVRTSPIPNMMGPGSGGTHSKVTSYDVVLYSGDQTTSILMSEFEKHPDATAFMQKYAEKLSLPARDIYRELQASAVSRRSGMRR